MVLLANEWNAHSSPSIEGELAWLLPPCVLLSIWFTGLSCLRFSAWPLALLYFIYFTFIYRFACTRERKTIAHLHPGKNKHANFPPAKWQLTKESCQNWEERVSLWGMQGIRIPTAHALSLESISNPLAFPSSPAPTHPLCEGRMTQFQSWPLTPPNVYIPCTSIITAATHPTPRDLHRGMPMLKSSLVFILVSDSLLKTWWMKLHGRCSFIETYSYHIHMMKTKLWLAHSTPHCATKLRLWNDVLWMKSN